MKGKKIKILDNKVKVVNLKSLRCKIVIKFFVFDRKMENITRVTVGFRRRGKSFATNRDARMVFKRLVGRYACNVS